ncbi:MAG: hypothetical protein UU47_C0025G0002 [candidate division TM6 bacterium GW2011_GWE2_41_16]|nr:MAG: hypothetical protein UU47_C0025G0002 [candidate division TM6 bacterium GW2011_GWE2_41_16]
MIDLYVVELNKSELEGQGGAVRIEQNTPGGNFYPHIYGLQNIAQSAVTKIFEVSKKGKDTIWRVVADVSVVTGQ